MLYKWHQSNSTVVISFYVPNNVSKSDITADISNTSINVGVRGYATNCEGTFYSSIKGSKWALKDNMVQVHVEKSQPMKWPHLLSKVVENPKAVVSFDYQPTTDEEIELITNEVILIVSKDESGWWEGSKVNNCGVFPSNFVEEFDINYQSPEDFEASNEATKIEEASPINQVSKVGFNMMGNMDELKNKLARRTANYSASEVEDSLQQQQQDDSQGSFLAVQPSGKSGSSSSSSSRGGGRVMLNRTQSQQIPSQPTTSPAVQPIQPIQPIQTLPSKTTESKSSSSSSKSEPKQPENKSSSTTDQQDQHSNNRITNLFKKPLKKITAITTISNLIHSDHEQDKDANKLKAKVIFDFETKEPGELALKKGEIITITSKDASGWWQGTNPNTGASGWFSCTFVEEIPATAAAPPPVVKVDPPKSSSSSKPKPPSTSSIPKSSSTPSSQTPTSVESRLQSISDTPKLEAIKKPSAGRNRKPPSRVRASFLLSDDERKEREKIKSSFQSHMVTPLRREDFPDELDDDGLTSSDDINLRPGSGGMSPPPLGMYSPGNTSPPNNNISPKQSSPPLEKPSRPMAPKRNPISSSLNSIAPPTGSGNTASGPATSMSTGSVPIPPSDSLSGSTGLVQQPPVSPTMSRPTPPKASLKPTNISNNNTEEGDSGFKIPQLKKTSPQPNSNLSDSGDAVKPNPPALKPIPKPRANVPPSVQQDLPPPPANEDNISKPPPLKSVKPPPQQSTTTDSDSQPQPPVRRLKPPPQPTPQQQQQPPAQNGGMSELEKKLKSKQQAIEEAETGSINTSTDLPPPLKPVNPEPTPIDTSKPELIKPLRSVKQNEESAAPPPPSRSSPPLSSQPAPNQPPAPGSLKPKIAPRNPTSAGAPPPPGHARVPSNTAPAPSSTPILTFNQICTEIANICNSITTNQNNESTFKHLHPPLPSSFFAVSACSIDGQLYNNSNCNDQPVPMFQAIQPFLYSIVCEELGVEEVEKFIGQDETVNNDKPLNSQKKAPNPFTLSGALVSSHLYANQHSNQVTRISKFIKSLEKLVHSNISCDMPSYLSQKSDSSDEMITALQLKNAGIITNRQPDDVLDFWYQLNSIQMNSKQLSCLAATLASDGASPFSNQLKLGSKSNIQKTNSLLKKCFASSNKSLITINSIDSGILLIVVPGIMGISVCSNSNAQNLEFYQQLITNLKL
eukprot:gene5962-7425_t